MIEAYPLAWPVGWRRTGGRKQSAFKVSSVGASSNRVLKELKLLGASKIVVSTNLQLRRDGLPYSSQAQPDDAGVAVYFTYKSKQMCFACDTYRKIQENLVAIAKTIEALRGMERWGASQMMERAFEGFAALPSKASSPWREVLSFGDGAVTRDEVESRFRTLAKSKHPDAGGSTDEFQRIVQAREAALLEL
jgi:hypothetical protein